MLPTLALALALLTIAVDPSVSFTPGATSPGTVNVEKLPPADLASLLAHPALATDYLNVSTVPDPSAPLDGSNPLLGSYQLDPDRKTLRFKARFPLEPFVHYRATYHPAGRSETPPITVHFRLHIAEIGVPPTEVVRVSPTAAVLPENLLKFYVEFSRPMSRGDAYAHVRLLDDAGKPVELPFLEIGEELWDPAGKRLTLLFDPGRIKSGLVPREQDGPILVAGRSYTFVVDRGFRDADGRPLRVEHRKPFRAGPADTTPPDPKTWRIEPPDAGTVLPLTLRFPEPLDRALLARMIGVRNATGLPLDGRVEIGPDETSWAFTPDTPWQGGSHSLVVGHDLEDRAGNAIGRPFEVDVFAEIAPKKDKGAGTITLPFRIGPGREQGERRPPRR